MQSADALLRVQVSSAHLPGPDRGHIVQVSMFAVAVVVISAAAVAGWRRFGPRLGAAWAEGRVVSTIGDAADGPTLAVVEYCAGQHRYHLPALLTRRLDGSFGGPVRVLYARADPTVARLAPAPVPPWALTAAAVVAIVGLAVSLW